MFFIVKQLSQSILTKQTNKNVPTRHTKSTEMLLWSRYSLNTKLILCLRRSVVEPYESGDDNYQSMFYLFHYPHLNTVAMNEQHTCTHGST